MTAHELARTLLDGPDHRLRLVLTDVDGGTYEAPVDLVTVTLGQDPTVNIEGDER